MKSVRVRQDSPIRKPSPTSESIPFFILVNDHGSSVRVIGIHLKHVLKIWCKNGLCRAQTVSRGFLSGAPEVYSPRMNTINHVLIAYFIVFIGAWASVNEQRKNDTAIVVTPGIGFQGGQANLGASPSQRFKRTIGRCPSNWHQKCWACQRRSRIKQRMIDNI